MKKTVILLPFFTILLLIMSGYADVRWWLQDREYSLNTLLGGRPFQGDVVTCWHYSKALFPPRIHPSVSIYLGAGDLEQMFHF